MENGVKRWPDQPYFWQTDLFNIHVLGTTWNSPQLQLLKVVKHQKEA